MKKGQKLHKTEKQQNTEESRSKFRKARNEVTRYIRKSKQNYNDKLTDKINSSNVSAKEWFKIAKQLTNKRSSSTFPALIENNQHMTNNDEKARVLYNFFCAQSTLDESNLALTPQLTVICQISSFLLKTSKTLLLQWTIIKHPDVTLFEKEGCSGCFIFWLV